MQLAGEIRTRLRKNEFFARIGGDEFALVITGATDEMIRSLAERLMGVIGAFSVQMGEVRLSLSSPLDPRSAEGFRCALAPLDRVDDVVAMMLTLLADCRVSDVQRLAGIHPDRDATTGQPLLFKAGGPIH